MQKLLFVLLLAVASQALIRPSDNGVWWHHDGRSTPLTIQFNSNLTTELIFVGPEDGEDLEWSPYNLSTLIIDEWGDRETLLWGLDYADEGSTMNGYYETLVTELMDLDYNRYNGSPPSGGAFGIINDRYMATQSYFGPSTTDKPSTLTTVNHYGLHPKYKIKRQITFENFEYRETVREECTNRRILSKRIQVLPSEWAPPFTVKDYFYYIGQHDAEAGEYEVIPCSYTTDPAGWYFHTWNDSTDEFYCNRRDFPEICHFTRSKIPVGFAIFTGVNPYEFLLPDNIQMNSAMRRSQVPFIPHTTGQQRLPAPAQIRQLLIDKGLRTPSQ